jgi:tetratricopeptide (TPR) repeat protein
LTNWRRNSPALLEQDKANLANNLMQLNRMLAKHSDKKAVQKLVDRVATPYDEPARGAFRHGPGSRQCRRQPARPRRNRKITATCARTGKSPPSPAPSCRPSNRQPTAIDGLNEFVDRNPSAHDARLALARLLISEKRYDESRRQFDRLIKDNPDNPEIIYPVAMLALQQGDTTTGRTQLERLLTTDFPDKSTSTFSLANSTRSRKKPDSALEHLPPGHGRRPVHPARSRAAQILMQQGKVEEARDCCATRRAARRPNASS